MITTCPISNILENVKVGKSDEIVPWYRIGKAEVPVDAITEFDTEEEDDATSQM